MPKKHKLSRYALMALKRPFSDGCLLPPLTIGNLIGGIAPMERLQYSMMPCHWIRPKAKPTTKSTSSRKKADNAEYIAYRFRGFPDDESQALMRRTTGCCRWMWNHMKSDIDDAVSAGRKRPTITPKKYKGDYPWLNEVDSLALANVQLRVERAYSDYESGSKGKPRFHKKRECQESYTTNHPKLSGDMLILPKLPAPIPLAMHRPIREGGVLKSVTVTYEPDGTWSFSLLMQYAKDPEKPLYNDAVSEAFLTGNNLGLMHVGLDMDLPKLFVASDGTKPEYAYFADGREIRVAFSKNYRKLEKRIAREQRKLSRMVKGSANYRKQQIRIAKLLAKAKHQRTDILNQISARMAKKYDVIGIENLDMAAMKQSLRLGKGVSDNGWGTFVEMLGRKAAKYGHIVIRVDKWFPSSKKCEHCGNIKRDLKLGEDTYICPVCGHIVDRDEQASDNIDAESLRIIASYADAEPKDTLTAEEIRGISAKITKHCAA